MNYEANLFCLYEEILQRTYRIGKSIAFIVNRPVKREIFAGAFRDRIVHHVIIASLEPLFEKRFIYDSYACRKWRGTLFGIRRIERFFRQCSKNFTQPAFYLKLDIAGFFMSIDRAILASMVNEYISGGGGGETLRYLVHSVLQNDPTKNCFIRWNREDWVWLPRTKSLFFSEAWTGLPIGNLTSQIFANVYLHPLDIFIKKTLGVRYYGRYVDDFVLIHEDRWFLESCIPKIESFLESELHLTLHPNKRTLCSLDEGLLFLGAYIKPRRTYIGNRTKSNFYSALNQWNQCEDLTQVASCIASLNSYLWLLNHFSTYFLRKRCVSRLSGFWRNFFYSSDKCSKFRFKIKRG
jgi:RNA-directed DNA polymerase